MAVKKSARKSAKKAAKKAKKRAPAKRVGTIEVVHDPRKKLSPFGRAVLQAFDAGVQAEYGKLARARIPVTVVVEGKVIRAIPRREGGRYVVREPEPALRLSRRGVR